MGLRIAHPDSRMHRNIGSRSNGALPALVALVMAAGCGRSAHPADAGFVAKWTATHYALARAERLSPPVASRTSAYAAIALYEGWAAFSDSLKTLAGQLNGLTELPKPAREERYDPALVAMEAQTVVLRTLYREGFASTGIAITALHDSLLGVRERDGVSPQVRRRSLEYGKRLGQAILEWAGQDGFSGRSVAYQPMQGAGYWVATATEAQFRSQNMSAERDFVGFDNSGHSTQSAAAAEVLTALFGDNRPYDDPTHVTLGHPVKRLASFREAAHQAGISRLYGGIHFQMDNLAGRAQGECLGRSVLARVHTRSGP